MAAATQDRVNPWGTCAKWGLSTPGLTAITINLCPSSPEFKILGWSFLLYLAGLTGGVLERLGQSLMPLQYSDDLLFRAAALLHRFVFPLRSN